MRQFKTHVEEKAITTENDKYNKLKEAVFKAPAGDGIFALLIYRPIVYVIMKKLKKPINPNKITVIALALYILSATFLLQEQIFTQFSLPHVFPLNIKNLQFILFLITYNIAFVFDCLDGAIARYFAIQSLKGRLLDGFADAFGNFAVGIGLAMVIKELNIQILALFMLYYVYQTTILTYFREADRKYIDTTKKMEFKTISIFGVKVGIKVGTLDHFVMTVNLIAFAYIFNFYLKLLTYVAIILWIVFFVALIGLLLKMCTN